MGLRSTVRGYWRQVGNPNSTTATPGVSMLVTPEFTFDATQASASVGLTLPKGAVPMGAILTNAAGTGGTSPTVDIGITGDTDGIVAEAAADGGAATVITMSGSALYTALTADTAIVAGVGASAATGGEVTARVLYYMDDDGVLND